MMNPDAYRYCRTKQDDKDDAADQRRAVHEAKDALQATLSLKQCQLFGKFLQAMVDYNNG